MTLPSIMTAVAIEGKGGPDVLVPVQLPVPVPGERQVLIRVAAAGVNRPDVMQRLGLYPAPRGHSEIPGLEVSGAVAAVGPNAVRYRVGDEVVALVNGGGYAEYCIADESCCLPVPKGLSIRDGAGLPETFFTVWHNVFERGRLATGEWFLVHGGTSGIGVTAIQLAKAFGARVIATAGSDDKCARCRELGADHAVNYRTQDFTEVVKSATGGRGVDVILDMVGGDYIERNVRALGDDGRLVNIAWQNGSKATLDFMRVMLKRLTLTGSTLRVRSTEVKSAIAQSLEAKVWPLIESGTVKVVVDSAFPLTEAREAHRRMDDGGHVGKLLLVP